MTISQNELPEGMLFMEDREKAEDVSQQNARPRIDVIDLLREQLQV